MKTQLNLHLCMAALIMATALGCAPAEKPTAEMTAGLSGADPTGKSLSTEAIQKAIDSAANTVAPGGSAVVALPAGTYTVTDIQLRSGVKLLLDKDAVIRASDDQKDYKHVRPVVWAKNASNIAIEGGTIIGAGAWAYSTTGEPGDFVEGNFAESNVGFWRCRDITIRDITLRQSAQWTLVLSDCERAVIQRVTIRNPNWATYPTSDGIDICQSRHVLIEDCDIETGDDAICLKSGSKMRVVEGAKAPDMYDIVARRCKLATTCNAFKIGTNTMGDIRDVLMEDITVVKHTGKLDPGNPVPTGECIAAISIQSNDGGAVSNITCRNFTIEDCHTPIFMVLQDRDSKIDSDLGSVGDITIENIVCKRSLDASAINVSRYARIGKVTLRNLDVVLVGKTGRILPNLADGTYPDANLTRTRAPIPAGGLFARGVSELVLEGKMNFVDLATRCNFCSHPTGRDMVVLDDVLKFDDSGVTGGNYRPGSAAK